MTSYDGHFLGGPAQPVYLVATLTPAGAPSTDGVLALSEAVYPTPIALHRLVTAVDGTVAPTGSDPDWAVNPGGKAKARFYCLIIIEDLDPATSDPILTFRPYFRNSSVAVAGEPVSFTVPGVTVGQAITFTLQPGIDVQADGDDVFLMLESQDASLTGSPTYSGYFAVSWR